MPQHKDDLGGHTQSPRPYKPVDIYGRPWGYQSIADDLANRITVDKEYSVYLPSIPEISNLYDVAYKTAASAVKQLSEWQLVIVAHGRRTRLAHPGKKTVSEAISQVQDARKMLDGVLDYLTDLQAQLNAEQEQLES